MGGLALGALLTAVGVPVTVIESHPDLLGGYAHTFSLDGYQFTAGPRYLWNFGDGQIGQRFLARCGLSEEVPLCRLSWEGFDHIYPAEDREPILVPVGWRKYLALLQDRFPKEREGLGRFFRLCEARFTLLQYVDANGLLYETWPTIIRRYLSAHPAALPSLAGFWLRRKCTLQTIFDECRLSPSLQAVLYAHGMILAEPPQTVSFAAYAGATLFNHEGSYYPRRGMDSLVQGLAERVRRGGGAILPGTPARQVKLAEGAGSSSVVTDKDELAADVLVSNIDPRTFLSLCADPSPVRLPRYGYSRSLTSVFLGVRNAAALRPRFGNWNIWYSPGPLDEGAYDADPSTPPPALYLNSPTLLTDGAAADAPPDCATITGFVPASYARFAAVAADSPESYRRLVHHHTERILDLVEERFVSGLRQRLACLDVRTPYDNARIVRAPQGNVYGKSFRPVDSLTRLPWRTRHGQLYFVGQYPGYAGVSSAIQSACRVFEDLTGERV